MKILYVNKFYSLVGGAEQYILSLCRALEDKGPQNVIVYGDNTTKELSNTISSCYFISGITEPNCQELKNKLAKLKEIIANENPDIIFLHQVFNPDTIQLLAEMKPTIRYVHDHKLSCISGRRMLNKVNMPCLHPLNYICQVHAYKYRCMPRNPTLGLSLIKTGKKIIRLHKSINLLVSSEFMKQTLVENSFEKDKITIIPYFTQFPKLADTATVNKTILCVSRLTPEKGVDYLLSAFSRIDESANLIIVGDGPSMAGLKEKAQALGISSRVTFTGWLSAGEISRFYQQSSLVVVPSVWPEPFGIVGIEAMAHAKPVVAFDVGGISEWLADKQSGYLVKRCDEAGLVEKINYLLEHEQEASGLGRLGRQIVQQRFTKEIHLEKFLALAESIIHSKF